MRSRTEDRRTAAGRHTDRASFSLQVEQGAAVTLGIRPEHVEMSPISEGGLAATVDLIEPTGFGIILHLGLHGLPFNVFTLHRDALAAGPTVTVAFPPQHLHLFDHVGNRVRAAEKAGPECEPPEREELILPFLRS